MRAFSQWSVKNSLLLHTDKTKEMVIDRRRSRSPPLPVSMDGVDIEVVSSYRYLGGPSTPLPSIERRRVGFASATDCTRSMCAVTCCTCFTDQWWRGTYCMPLSAGVVARWTRIGDCWTSLLRKLVKWGQCGDGR